MAEQAPAKWDALRQRAADPNAATFVKPTGEVEVYQRGGLDDEQQKTLEARGLKPATPEDIEKRAQWLEAQEHQARAAIELGLNTATAGAIGKDDFRLATDRTSPELRREVLETESPGLALGARVVGGALPMALTGGLGSAAGLGRAALGAAEGVAVGLAEENAQAAWENRELSAGNVALAGLGGAIFSSAIPAVLRRGSRALAKTDDAVAAAAGDVVENVGPRLEANAAKRASQRVGDMPPGPARDEVLRTGAKAHLERVKEEVTDVASRANETVVKSDIPARDLKRLISKNAPNQTAWATQTAEELRSVANSAKAVANDVTESAADSAVRRTGAAADSGGVPNMSVSKTGKRSIKRYESDMAQIDAMTPDMRKQFDELVQQQAAVARVSPFGTSKAQQAQLYEIRKDILEEYGDLFPKAKAVKNTRAVADDTPVSAVLRRAADSLLESKGALDTLQRARGAMAELRKAGVDDAVLEPLRKGVTDESLFGRAAEAVRDFEASASRAPRSPLEGFDPSDLTQASKSQLENLAASLEDRAAARAKWDIGGGKDATAKRLLADAKRIRDSVALADDVAGARARETIADTATGAVPSGAPAGPGPTRPPSMKDDLVSEGVEYLAERAIGAVVPGAGMAMRLGRRLWSSVDASGRESIRQAARSAARGALRGVETATEATRRIVPSALQTFAADFPGPQEAFAARKTMLADMMRDPTVLPNALASSLGDLPRTDPKLFQQVAARMARGVQYVTANLPAGIATTMTHPRGVQPSRDTLRDYAVVWNSAMHPETVIDAVHDGSASPEQMRALATVDPDTYATLKADIVAEVADSYEQTPAQTKQWLDILFQSDGIAGPAYSWKASDYMAEGSDRTGQGMQMSSMPPPSKQAPQSRGISNIEQGVTNRGA